MKLTGHLRGLALGALLLLITLTCAVPAFAKTTSITISAAGDCTLGSDSRYNSIFNNYAKTHSKSYFLSKVKSVFEADDLTIVNFEGTLTTSTHRANKTFTFKGSTSNTKILTEGSVEVVTLANNHSWDFGLQGYHDTKDALKAAGISYCRKTTIVYKTINGVKVATLGFAPLNGDGKTEIKAGIAAAKKKGADLIIVNMHWGVERSYYPNSSQKTLAHYAIDQGADLILGHHPHVLQGMETYHGKMIVYSLGNFCFGGNSNPSDKDTMIYRQTFTFTDGVLSKKINARVYPCSLSSHTNYNDFQPRILTGTAKKKLIAKINRLTTDDDITVTSTGKLTID